jgi:diacylglycerol kinase (ATP)
MLRKYALIINPAARSGKSKEALPKIRNYFLKNKLNLTIFPTTKKGDAVKLAFEAAKKRYDVIIAGGGDGTINEVVNGIAGTPSALGIIPLGTTNVLAMELKIPFEAVEACKIITTHKALGFDIGNVNGRYFLSWVGIGLHSHMIKDTEDAPILKQLFGKIAYPITGLKNTVNLFSIKNVNSCR